MTIRIDKLDVKNLGPIKNISFEFKDLNLIYGPNESGKTFIVEFLIRSLFKNYSKWDFRSNQANGELIVSGLTNKQSRQKFFPSSKRKINDFLSENYLDLPLNISRLLAIRGSDLFFDDKKNKVEKSIFIDFLSNQQIIESILKGIHKAVQTATIDENGLHANEKGLIIKRIEYLHELKKIDNLLDEIDNNYSQGEIKAIQDRKKELVGKVAIIEKAKRHKAFLITKEISESKDQLSKYPEETLGNLKNDLFAYSKNKGENNQIQNDINKISGNNSKYEWLCIAKDEYEKRTLTYKKEPSFYLLLIPATIAVGAAITIYTKNDPLISLLLLFLCSLFTGLFVYFYKLSKDNPENSKEIEGISNKFKEYFSEELTSITQIVSLINEYESYHENFLGMKSSMERLRKNESESTISINQLFYVLGEKNISKNDWEEKYKGIEKFTGGLKTKIRELENNQNSLNVSPTAYIEEWDGIEYDRDEETNIFQEKEIIEGEKAEIEKKYLGLSQRLIQETGNPDDTSWEALNTALLEKRNSIEQNLKTTTAKIIAGNKTTEVLNEISDKEDEKILKKLEDPIIISPIKNCTNRYIDLELRQDEIYLSDSQNWFNFNDLSTGAMDQVLFALRIGFSQLIFKKEPLFLILDDAFQNADWDRRENLFDMVIKLVKQEWQIFYFTMDNHIRDRLKAIGKKELGNNFKAFNL